jgi:protein MYSM1
MASPFGTSTRLEKLLDSLRTHLFIKAEQEAQFIDKVKELVEKEFMKSETNQNVYSPHL